jgi:hypothetical protein
MTRRQSASLPQVGLPECMHAQLSAVPKHHLALLAVIRPCALDKTIVPVHAVEQFQRAPKVPAKITPPFRVCVTATNDLRQFSIDGGTFIASSGRARVAAAARGGAHTTGLPREVAQRVQS